MTAIKQVTPTWPVVELFGPTIQGEGVDQGVSAHFVRFGGCDYRCHWCDTPYAVVPEEVRKNSTKKDADEIVTELTRLDNPAGGCVPWVVLTGGNPALHDLQTLVDELHEAGYLVAVETQGSRWRQWMRDVDRLCVSPKPPSAREPKSRQSALQRFLDEALRAMIDGTKPYEWLFLKVVIFDEADLDYAELVRAQLSNVLLYLSVGNDAGRTVGQPTREDARTIAEVRGDLCDRFAWLIDRVHERPALTQHDVLVQMQAHTLAWGNGQGF